MAPSSIQQRKQFELLQRGLGRLADVGHDRTDSTGGRGRPPLRLVQPSVPAGDDISFPLGARTRKVDTSGRLKLSWESGSLAELLGWGSGVLDAVCHDGWLVLTQRPEQVGVTATRNSHFATVTNAGTSNERISLRTAHLEQVGASHDDHLFVAPLPDRGALVVTNPCRLAAFASAHVRDLITAEASDPLCQPTSKEQSS